MKITRQKYEKLRDMELLNCAKYDINMRVEMIVRDVQQLLQKYEDEARTIFHQDSKKDNKQ